MGTNSTNNGNREPNKTPANIQATGEAEERNWLDISKIRCRSRLGRKIPRRRYQLVPRSLTKLGLRECVVRGEVMVPGCSYLLQIGFRVVSPLFVSGGELVVVVEASFEL